MRKNLGAAMPCSTQQYRQQHSQPEHAESSGTNNKHEEPVERLKARVNELSAGRKTVKEDKIRYEDLVKQLKLVEANEKLEAFLAEAVKENKVKKMTDKK